MSREELKPCPFCGAEARARFATLGEEQYTIVNGHFYTVCECSNYCVKIVGTTEEEAIKKWNRRANESI